MSTLQSDSYSCDQSARDSVIIGILGALITALIHFTITSSSHFDFLIRDAEFYAVLAAVVLAALIAILGLGTGLNALHHLPEPHRHSAKPIAILGMTLDLASLLPATLILAIALETFLLKFITIQYTFPE